ncbi:hypothetical protein KCP70_25230 [Salmonella enterica subsp. enterica]|nr:hypothetical protein KCP70_25230 [Salmonella enterica subsp. enterica]
MSITSERDAAVAPRFNLATRDDNTRTAIPAFRPVPQHWINAAWHLRCFADEVSQNNIRLFIGVIVYERRSRPQQTSC